MRRTPIHPGPQQLERKGGSRYPQAVDERYRAYIRGLDCAAQAVLGKLSRQEIAAKEWWPCGSRPERTAVEAAHVRTWGATGEDRGNVVPLCPVHHDEQEGRTKRFCERYGIDLYQLAADLLVGYEEEAARG